jgi:hypothetical protein
VPTLIAIPLALLLARPAHAVKPGMFAAQGVSIGDSIRWSGPRDRPMRGALTAPAPDGRSRLTVRYRERGNEFQHDFHASLSVRLSGTAGAVGFDRGYMPIGDILWSPDSRHVALSLSAGGAGGVYDLFILGGGHGGQALSAPFRVRLNPPRSCDLRRSSNVAPVTWLSPRRLLVMARQLWEDSCPQKYRARFYDYDLVTGRIVRSYPLAEAKQRFGSRLGSLAR